MCLVIKYFTFIIIIIKNQADRIKNSIPNSAIPL